MEENKKLNDKENQNEVSKFDSIANKLYNMNCGLSGRQKRAKERARVTEGNKQKMGIGKKISIFAILFAIITVVIFVIAFINYINHFEYYNQMSNTLVDKLTISPRYMQPDTQGFVGNIVMDIVSWFFFGLWMFIVKFVVMIIIVPICNIIDALVGIVVYFVNGGVLRTFGNMLFFSEDYNTMQQTFLTIFIICIAVFFIAILMATIKQVIAGEGDYLLIFKNIVKSGVQVVMMFGFPLILYAFTSLVANAIIVNATGGSNMRFSMVLLAFSQKDTSIFGGNNDLWLQPTDLSNIYQYGSWDINGITNEGYLINESITNFDWAAGWNSDSIGYGWFTNINDYADGMTGKDYIAKSFDSDSNGVINSTEYDAFTTALYAKGGPVMDWAKECMHQLSHGVSLVLFIISIVISVVVMCIMVMQLFLRSFQIIGLMMIGPWTVAITPYDGGEKFGEWKKNMFDKFMQLILFCILYAMYISLLANWTEFSDDWKGHLEVSGTMGAIMRSSFAASVFGLICVICGSYAIILLPAEFAGIIGGLTALMGAKMMGSTIKKGAKIAKGMASGGASVALSALDAKSGGRVTSSIGGVNDFGGKFGGGTLAIGSKERILDNKQKSMDGWNKRLDEKKANAANVVNASKEDAKRHANNTDPNDWNYNRQTVHHQKTIEKARMNYVKETRKVNKTKNSASFNRKQMRTTKSKYQYNKK